MKKIIICCFVLGIAVFIYFQSRSQINTKFNPSGRATTSSSDTDIQNPVFNDVSSLSNTKNLSAAVPTQIPANDERSKPSNDKANEGFKKNENPMNRLATVLPDALVAEGFPAKIGTCILKVSHENLNAKPPLSLDSLADKCSDLEGLTEDSKLVIRKIFRDSIKNSMSFVYIDTWYRCASSKILKGTVCLNEHYQSLVDDFYSENRGNSQLKGSEFTKNWENIVTDNMEKLIKQCPQLPTSLTEVYAYECNP